MKGLLKRSNSKDEFLARYELILKPQNGLERKLLKSFKRREPLGATLGIEDGWIHVRASKAVHVPDAEMILDAMPPRPEERKYASYINYLRRQEELETKLKERESAFEQLTAKEKEILEDAAEIRERAKESYKRLKKKIKVRKARNGKRKRHTN